MNEYVVGVDGAVHSRMALRWAAAIAAVVAGGRIRAVQSWTHPRSAVLPIAPVPVSAKEMDEQIRQAIVASGVTLARATGAAT